MDSSIKRTYYTLKVFLIILISLLFIELSFKLIAFNNLFGIELVRIFVFSISASLVVSAINTLFKQKVCKIMTLIFIFFVAIYGLLQLTFYNLLNNYMSLNASTGGGLSRVVSQIPEFIKSIRIVYLILFIPFIATLILFILDKKFILYEKPTKLKITLLISLIVMSKVLSIISVNSKVFEDNNQIRSNKELYRAPVLLNLSLKEFGILKFSERDLIYMFFPNDNYSLEIIDQIDNTETIENIDYERKIDDQEFIKIMENEKNSDIKQIHKYFLSQPITNKNEYTGYFKGKNLVLIMVEAFDMLAINEELTPTLYNMSKDGWYFENYYTPKYSCTTGESEYIAETSIIPSSTVCTPNYYVNNNYSTSIFNLFKNSGYYASSYHSWTDEFYNRSKLHINMGSDLYLDYNSLNMSNILGWPLDTEMFENSYKYYSDKEPFFTFIITSSTHFPYDTDTTVTKKHWDKVKDKDYPDMVKRYLAKAIELDLSIKLLMNKLDEDGKLNDTVFVIFGDHHPLHMPKEYLNTYSSIDRFKDFNMDRLPFIIYNNSVDSKVLYKTASTFDILPTIANLFDLNYDPRYYVGVDMFSEDESIVIFTNGSWITDKCLYDSSKNEYKSLTGEALDQEYIEKINKKVNDKFYVSNKVLTLDYFKYRFKAQ